MSGMSPLLSQHYWLPGHLLAERSLMAKSSSSPFVPSFSKRLLGIVGGQVVCEDDDRDAVLAVVNPEKGFCIRTERWQQQQAVAEVFGALTPAAIPQDVKVGAPMMAAAKALKAWDSERNLRLRNQMAYDAVQRICKVESERPGTITNEQGVVWNRCIASGIADLWAEFPRERLSLDNSGFSLDRQAFAIIADAWMTVSKQLPKVKVADVRAIAAQI